MNFILSLFLVALQLRASLAAAVAEAQAIAEAEEERALSARRRLSYSRAGGGGTEERAILQARAPLSVSRCRHLALTADAASGARGRNKKREGGIRREQQRAS